MDIKFYCSRCGQHIEAPEEMAGVQSNCPSCQAPVVIPSQASHAIPPVLETAAPKVSALNNGTKFYPAFFLGLFLGVFGIHRFYLGKIWTGLFQLITLGGLGIWAMVDVIRILLGKFKDKAGKTIPNPNPKIAWSIYLSWVLIVLAFQFFDKRSSVGNGSSSLLSGASAPSSAYKNYPPSRTDNGGKAVFQEFFNGDMIVKDEQGFSHSKPAAQCLFDAIHPIGTGKNVTVNDLVLNKDENGKIQSVGLDLTLYWEGPLKSGSTQFKMLYDAQSEQFGHITVVRTDGITREDINNFSVGYQIGSQLRRDFQGN
jgi:TM2 domain-containing membrane protein YozV